MTIKDENVKAILQTVNLWFLDDAIDIYEDDDEAIAGMSEMEILQDLAEYYLKLHKEKGNLFHEDLMNARRVIKNGSRVNSPIKWAKDIVEDYERLKQLVKQLRNIGTKLESEVKA